jgi:hypothetical protein
MRPRGVTFIAVLMFLGGVVYLVLPQGVHLTGIGTIRAPWLRAVAVVQIALGIGLLRLSRWARVAVIVAVTLSLVLQVVALASTILASGRPLSIAIYLLRIPLWGLIPWYLQRPEIRKAFADTRSNVELRLG